MQLNNLTSEQVKLLDAMWKINTVGDLARFKSTLKPRLQRDMEVLVELLRIEHIDELIDGGDIPVSNTALNQIIAKGLEK